MSREAALNISQSREAALEISPGLAGLLPNSPPNFGGELGTALTLWVTIC
jgi:hypothetical protein